MDEHPIQGAKAIHLVIVLFFFLQLYWVLLLQYTVILTNVVGSKHEAKRQDRKFTWYFYE